MGKTKTPEEYGQVVHNFLKMQEQLKENQEKFEEVKKNFYTLMEDYFEANEICNKTWFPTDTFDDSTLFVTRVQKSIVDFDVTKLEKALGKAISKDVIDKDYQITDFEGLIAYLKSCGVKPKEFKKFIKVNKSVNTKKLDNLEELGKITVDQLEGCYTVRKQNPYFKVVLK